MPTLNLTIKKQWFNEILAGEKTEEYREFKPYWTTRLCNSQGRLKHFDKIVFRNGYHSMARCMTVECNWVYLDYASRARGHGAPGRTCYIIKLGKIISVKNIPATAGREE